jgi:hypothetical protein
MEIKPAANARNAGNYSDGDFELIVSIEALSLPDAASKNQLPKKPGNSLKLAQETAYRDAITRRNFFAVYDPALDPSNPSNSGRIIAKSTITPPPPPPPPRPMDRARFVYVSGITLADDKAVVWVRDWMGGPERQLAEGEEFDVGSGKAEVYEIVSLGEVIIRFDGKLLSLHVGENLREGKEIKE